MQWFISTVEKREENHQCEALGRGTFKQDVGEAPLNMVMREVRDSAANVVTNEDNNIVRHRRQTAALEALRQSRCGSGQQEFVVAGARKDDWWGEGTRPER